jgi:hypothetical protein
VELGVTARTVGKWPVLLVRYRIGGLTDAPRPKGTRNLTDDRVEEIIWTTLQSTQQGLRVGACAGWQNGPESANRPCPECGVPSAKAASIPDISLSTSPFIEKVGTSSGSTSIPPIIRGSLLAVQA